ncbi:hypothetical protein AVV02_gp185 [Bacillus phage AvesoBmore]|uniref:Uncharacterized protein n=1 Tax=Bacillus phage AvesoBmore TaxID=1698451 RepID=A0A0K2D0J6_9CAUD|nr:hypothetical protein AVV02_gp185 [Bacillus phage AvesoBmore]ALA13349.1 hypothetical protein AVESOBMORE_185 [Bacillus phage AvesoBmore]
MATIEILYNYEDKEDIKEVVEVLVELGKLNYCVDSRMGKGYLKIKKVHQEVVSMSTLERIAAAEQKTTEDSIVNTKTAVKFEGLDNCPMMEVYDEEFLPSGLRVYRLGKKYVAALNKSDAINYIVKSERIPSKDVEKSYLYECALNKCGALLPTDCITNLFVYQLKEDFPSGVRAAWINGYSYYDILFEYLLSHVIYTEPFTLASIEDIEGEIKVIYNVDVADMVHNYLRTALKPTIEKNEDFTVTYG